MKVVKRVLISLLVFSMLCSCCVMSAFAAARGTCGAGLTWTLDAYGTLTIKGNGSMPAYAATTDGSTSFRAYSTQVKKVKIENGLLNIARGAFSAFTSMTQVTIPNSVSKIEANAFSGCSALESVDMGRGPSKIDENAFRGCASLKKVSLPAGVGTIANNAFAECTSLQVVEILNDNCKFPNGDFLPETAAISGNTGSTAEKYAKKYGHNFVVLGTAVEEPTTPSQTSVDENKPGSICPLCGQVHEGFPGVLLGWLHMIIYYLTSFTSATHLF